MYYYDAPFVRYSPDPPPFVTPPQSTSPPMGRVLKTFVAGSLAGALAVGGPVMADTCDRWVYGSDNCGNLEGSSQISQLFMGTAATSAASFVPDTILAGEYSVEAPDRQGSLLSGDPPNEVLSIPPYYFDLSYAYCSAEPRSLAVPGRCLEILRFRK